MEDVFSSEFWTPLPRLKSGDVRLGSCQNFYINFSWTGRTGQDKLTLYSKKTGVSSLARVWTGLPQRI